MPMYLYLISFPRHNMVIIMLNLFLLPYDPITKNQAIQTSRGKVQNDGYLAHRVFHDMMPTALAAYPLNVYVLHLL